VYLDATTSILNRLCYSRGIGQVQIRLLQLQDASKKLVEMGVAA